jgi:diguanylate cyclase (GGDEF)-like protein
MRFHTVNRNKAAVHPFAVLVIGIAALATVAGACAYMAWDAHRQAGLRAQETAESVVQLLERDVSRNIEALDLSLQAVTEGISNPEVMQAGNSLRRMILFDRSASATGLGALIVFDKDGNNIIDSLHNEPVAIEPVVDRDYFQAQAAADSGLFISQTYQSRLIGKPVIGLSRRISDSQGGFMGVALATIEVQYLSELIAKLKLGPQAVVTLLRTDGMVLLRQSPKVVESNIDVSKLASYQHMQGQPSGSFIATSQYDHVERLYSFRLMGKYPLLLSVGIATGTIYADWWQKTTTFVALIALMTAVILALLAKLSSELKLKAAAEDRLVMLNLELEQLSLTDSLTGLPNRRSFDDVFPREARRSHRTGEPVSLVLIDIDHFKLFNDSYGHAEGDRTLKLVAEALQSTLRRPGDMVFRVGGEEFAAVLPGTNEAGAIATGEAMCRAIRALRREHAKSDTGFVTVSAGLTTVRGSDTGSAYAIADQALYAAKQSGRNRVMPLSLPLAS